MRDLTMSTSMPCARFMGYVIRPDNEQLNVAVVTDAAIITRAERLDALRPGCPRALDSGNASEFRGSFIDFAALRRTILGRSRIGRNAQRGCIGQGRAGATVARLNLRSTTSATSSPRKRLACSRCCSRT